MEDIVKYKKFDFSESSYLLEDREEEENDVLKISTKENDIDLDFLNRSYEKSFEDSSSFLNNFFRGKDPILNENWEVNENIQGRILSFDENEVYVDCLIDLEKNIIQSRRFPITLFNNLSRISENKPVLIKTRLKPGAIRIDVYSGEGIVNLEVFEMNNEWDSLRGKNLDTKLSKW